MGAVYNKLTAKQDVIDEARQSLINTDDPTEHREIVASARKKLSAIDRGQQQTGAGGIKIIRDASGRITDVQ
jgi:hypothetical protein